MAASNGNGGYSHVVEPEYVTQAEFDLVEDKVDTCIDEIRMANKALSDLDKKSNQHGTAIADVKATLKKQGEELAGVRAAQKAQGEDLANVGAAVIRIESALKTAAEKLDEVEEKAEEADEKAERASFTNETDRELAKTFLEDKRQSLFVRKLRQEDEIQARRDKRDERKRFIAWFCAGMTPLILLAIIAQLLGIDIPILSGSKP